MKTVILCGGLGTRLEGDNPDRIPKPLTTIGDTPILEHIMNIYGNQGFNDFILCLGYKGNLIKKYFNEYFLTHLDFHLSLRENISYITSSVKDTVPNAEIDLIDTGLNTATGSRIKKIKEYINNESFMLTYGDGLANIDLNKLLEFHKSHDKLVTMSTTKPKGQFGIVEVGYNNEVINFQEKPLDKQALMNIGFFVIEPEVLDWIGEGNNIWFEADVLPSLVKQGQVMAYQHSGQFKAMDSPKDKKELEEMWNTGNAFWKA
jgi:glucose-1-phosphate cytidylyltransferase